MTIKKAIAVFLTFILTASQVVAYEQCARADQYNTIHYDCVIYNDIAYKVTLKQWYSGYEKMTWYLDSAQNLTGFSFSNAQNCLVIVSSLDLHVPCIWIGNVKYPQLLLTAKKWHDGVTYWEYEG